LQKTSYIDQATAKQFDETIGRKAYFDNVNSVQCILQTLVRQTETRDEGMFAEAPIVTRNDDRQDCKFSLLVSSRRRETSIQSIPRASAHHYSAKSTENEKFLRGLCKGSPLPHHFSETFLDDYEITELAKVSLF
jgi:hypothetical protein